MFSAAAPLAQEVIDYFLSLNIRIWEIYGMSEIRFGINSPLKGKIVLKIYICNMTILMKY